MLFRSFPPSMSLGITLDLSSIQAKLGDLEARGADNSARVERQLRLLNAGVQKLHARELREPAPRAASAPRTAACGEDLQGVRGELAGLAQQVAGLSQQVAALTDALEHALSRVQTPARVSRADTPENAAAFAESPLNAERAAERLERARRGSDASDSSFCLP
jgi:hypothetical protein